MNVRANTKVTDDLKQTIDLIVEALKAPPPAEEQKVEEQTKVETPPEEEAQKVEEKKEELSPEERRKQELMELLEKSKEALLEKRSLP